MVEGVVINGVWTMVVVIEGVRILVVVGVGIIFVGLERIINFSSSIKSLGLSGKIGIVLFSWVNLKSP